MSSELRRFFRHCPSCGHRFEIRLVSKKLIRDEESAVERVPAQSTPLGAWQFERSDFLATRKASYLSLEGPEPTVVDIQDFQYTYRCKHCGHVWTEVKVEERGVGRVSEEAVEAKGEPSPGGDKDAPPSQG